MIDQAALAELLQQSLDTRPLLRLEGVSWRPDYGAENPKVAVHLVETAEVGDSIQRRIVAATQAGYRTVMVILHRGAAFDSESQDFLLSSDTELIVVGDHPALYASYVELVIREAVVLETAVANRAVVSHLENALAAPKDVKGRLLETAIGLAQSQVPGWRVYERNLRTANEELDVVVENNSARAPWNGSPYIVSECKNWSEPVGRPEYDSLHMKLKERGGFARLGFALAAVGFTGGFYERAKSFGTHDISIVPISIPWLLRRMQEGSAVEDALGSRVRQVVFDRQWEETD